LLFAAARPVFAEGTAPLAGGEPAQAGDLTAEAGPLSWRRLFEPCAGDCAALFDSLAPEDAEALRALPERVARTIEAVGADISAWPAEAQDALALVQALGPSTALAMDPGKRSCTVIWFGFLDEGGDVVGRHQCRIDEERGELSLTKLTGEGRFVRLVELAGGANVAVGRTYLPEQAERQYDPARPDNQGNENFGNFVGLAFPAERNGLVIVSADMRGFTEPDDTFFEVLLVE
jgi:hypothetical protein